MQNYSAQDVAETTETGFFGEKKAKALCKKAGHDWRKPVEIEDLHKFQNYLMKKKFQILVFSSNTNLREPIFKGTPNDRTIALAYHDHHYHVILLIHAFMHSYCVLLVIRLTIGLYEINVKIHAHVVKW